MSRATQGYYTSDSQTPLNRHPRRTAVSRTPTPPIDDEGMCKRLLNRLYLLEEDALFIWAQSVRASVYGEGDER